MHQSLSPFISSKFKFWSFISMVLLVFVHGYNLQMRYLQPFTVVEEPITVNSFLQYFLANGIFRFRIPLLFIISGYLFALYDDRNHGSRIKKRVRTLFVPYLLWSAIALGFTYALEMFVSTKGLVESSHLMQIDENRIFLHQYQWHEWLVRWIIFPVPYQLWFIRVLLFYNIIYLGLRWCVLHRVAKWIFFPIAIFLWLTSFGFIIIEGEGLLFFSLGVWMQKTQFNIEIPKKWMNVQWWSIVFVVTAVIKTWLAFKAYPLMGESLYPLLMLLHKITVVAGLITAWFGGNALVKWCMRKQWFLNLTPFAFFIYALHVPFVTYAIDGMFKLLNFLPHYRLITFFLLPFITISMCITIGAAMRKLLPKVYTLLTGGRGF